MTVWDKENGLNYGFDTNGDWFSVSLEGWQPIKKHDRPATEKEIITELIAEAKRRGYKNGNYKCLYEPNNTEIIKENNLYFDYEKAFNDLWIIDGEGNENLIFKSGKWADIISHPKEIKKDGFTYILKE